MGADAPVGTESKGTLASDHSEGSSPSLIGEHSYMGGKSDCMSSSSGPL